MSEKLIDELKSYYSSNPKNFTSFRLDIEKILKNHIKPLTKGIKNGQDNSWRTNLINRFKGRGSKWVFVSLENIEPRLEVLELEGINCSVYRKNITKIGKAWIRFSGARLNNGIKCAAFEIRTKGSTIDHPKQLHLICVDGLDGVIESMPGTPKALKLEEDSSPMPGSNKTRITKPKKEKTQLNLKNSSKSPGSGDKSIKIELSKPPQNNNPEDWEAFLLAEGLTGFDEESEDL